MAASLTSTRCALVSLDASLASLSAGGAPGRLSWYLSAPEVPLNALVLPLDALVALLDALVVLLDVNGSLMDALLEFITAGALAVE